uniref:Uncharacterized protein n=1 Tax=Romanomermis culicivorax TaxID=13658 RepID=A0A915IX83_ROMCU
MVFLPKPDALRAFMCKSADEVITVKDPQYIRDSCKYRVDDYEYVVVRRSRPSGVQDKNIAQWEYCSDPWNTTVAAASFNRQVCQRNDQCYPLEVIVDMVQKLGGTISTKSTCSQLIGELKRISEPFLQRFYAGNDSRCDFGEIISGSSSWNTAQSQTSVPGSKVSASSDTAIDACRNGIFNKVYYTNDEATHCVINDKSEYRGKCVVMGDLFSRLQNLGRQRNKISDTDDNTIEYKRYILQCKMFSETNPEVHSVTYGQRQYGAKTFCDVGLTYFPAKNTELYDAIKLQESRLPLKYPTNVNLVYYTSSTNSIGCYIPSNHIIFNGYDNHGKQCITFEAGENLISGKDSAERDEQDYRRHYMAGVLRLYDMSEIPRIRIEPNIYHWSLLRQDSNGGTQHYRPRPIGRLLQDIEAALGYEDDPKRIFTINEKLPVPRATSQVQVPLSVQAFCAAIVEMIPFSQDELRNRLSPCPTDG